MKNLFEKLKVFFVAFMFSALILPLVSTTPSVEASTKKITQPSNGVAPIEANQEVNDITISGDNQLPNVSLDDATDLVERKTYDVVKIMQVFARPFSIIIFIFSALMALFGAVTKGGYVSKGLIGMFIAGLIFTATMYAPEIVAFFSGWLTS